MRSLGKATRSLIPVRGLDEAVDMGVTRFRCGEHESRSEQRVMAYITSQLNGDYDIVAEAEAITADAADAVLV